MLDLQQFIKDFVPRNPAQAADKKSFCDFLNAFQNTYTRDNLIGHITSSAWVVNADHTKVLLCHHNLYNRWVWLGGHADGNQDLAAVALTEVREESGLTRLKLISKDPCDINVLTVRAHIKRGVYVPAHLHYNVCYVIEADENEPLQIKPDENSGLSWVSPQDVITLCAGDEAFDCYVRLMKNLNMIP